MQQLDFSRTQTQTSHHWLLSKLLVHLHVVPQPAEGLGEYRGTHQEQHQDDEAHVGPVLVEINHS